MTKITASVVLYKTPEEQLQRLLESVRNSTVAIETYLIDNSPEPLQYACMQQEHVHYFKAEENRGYGAGHNMALRMTMQESDYHLVLNPDIYFDAHAVAAMVLFMDSDISIGQVMPRIISPDGTLQHLCKLLPTPTDLFLRRFAFGPLNRYSEYRNACYELHHADYEVILDVPNLSGCFMAFRCSALKQVGLFDERYFLYLEDFDLTRRMHAMYRTVYFPSASVVHEHSRSSYKRFGALWVHVQSAVRYFNKWGWIRDVQRAKFNRTTLERLPQASR